MSDLSNNLADLFRRAAEAHHDAFIEANGDDPNWPHWYANYLRNDLDNLLGTRLTEGDLADLLVAVDREFRTLKPGTEWPAYYAQFFMDRYHQ